MAVVRVFNAHPRYRLRKRPLARYARRVLKSAGVARGTVSVICIGSRACRSLNRQYLGHDYVTDVISFPLEVGKTLEGEIYVNLDRARKQGREYKVPFAHEVARLVIHGALHLVGYDDRSAGDARRMRATEEQHLRHWFESYTEVGA